MAERLHEIDMLSGRPLPGILRFSLPLAASSMLQLLFNAADIIVVGKFVGATALAAVGSNGSLVGLLVGLFVGISVGVNVTVARMVGNRDDAGIRRAVHTSVTMAAVLGVAVALAGGALAQPLLRLMRAPEDVLPLASLYLRIYFFGVPATMLYNFCAGVLRAYGDTKRPFWFLSAAGVVNVILNLFFVIVLKIGVAGVALATVISQAVSCVLVIRCLTRISGPAHLDLRRLQFDAASALQIVRIGVPAGMQTVLLSVSNMVIQSSVNSFGAAVVAGNSAAINVEGFLNAASASVSHAAITFISQNCGARRLDRLRIISADCMAAVALIGLPLAAALLIFGRQVLGIYVSSSDPAFETVIGTGLLRIRYVGIFQILCGAMHTAAGLVRGLGKSWPPMVTALVCTVILRIVWVGTVFRAVGTLPSLYISYPISWTITIALHLTCFFLFSARMRRAASAA